MALPVPVVPLFVAVTAEAVVVEGAAVPTELAVAVAFAVVFVTVVLVAAPPVCVAQPTATADRQATRASAVMVLVFRLAFENLKRIGLPPIGGSNGIAP